MFILKIITAAQYTMLGVITIVNGAGFSSLGSALALNYSRLLLQYEFESRVGR